MSRYIDIAIRILIADVEKDRRGRPRWKKGTDRELHRVGGCWDRRKMRWAPPRKGRRIKVLPIRLHRGQERAAVWLVDWLERWAKGDWVGVKRMWSALFVGGRRSGKTHIACAALVIFAVLKPRALIWAISPTLETGDELDEAFRKLLPRRWYRRTQAKTGKSTTFKLANGSRILLKSGVRAARLKAGRVDIALINEAQEQSRDVYVKLRAPIADRGGLVLMTANPPDKPIGRWVEEHFIAARNNEIQSIAFEFDPRANPFIDYDALASMEQEVDEKTFQRDVLGLFAPIGDVVFHAYRAKDNWIDPPAGLLDITHEVSKRELGRSFGYLVGMDVQRDPHMAATIHKIFRDPEDPNGELDWVVDEFVIEDSNEEELIDQIESTPRWTGSGSNPGEPRRAREDDCYRGSPAPDDEKLQAPVYCGTILDASGWWQDSEHAKGRKSDRRLAEKGWRHCYKPQKDSDANPEIRERVKTGNARLGTKSGKRRMFFARHCVRTAEAVRCWENTKHGVPNRSSDFAHVNDAWSYVEYRLHGTPKPKKKSGTGYSRVTTYDRADLIRGAM